MATRLDGGGFVVGMRSTPGAPFDRHTLAEALEQVAVHATSADARRNRRT